MDRPDSCPAPGVIDGFDVGWECAELGMERDTVDSLAHPTKRDWALLAWDIYWLCKRRNEEDGQEN